MAAIDSDINLDWGAVIWLEDDNTFAIVKLGAFRSKILPAFFKKIKFTHFVRRLTNWGFEYKNEVNEGRQTFRHAMFRKGRYDLVRQILLPTSKIYLSKAVKQSHPIDEKAKKTKQNLPEEQSKGNELSLELKNDNEDDNSQLSTSKPLLTLTNTTSDTVRVSRHEDEEGSQILLNLSASHVNNYGIQMEQTNKVRHMVVAPNVVQNPQMQLPVKIVYPALHNNHDYSVPFVQPTRHAYIVNQPPMQFIGSHERRFDRPTQVSYVVNQRPMQFVGSREGLVNISTKQPQYVVTQPEEAVCVVSHPYEHQRARKIIVIQQSLPSETRFNLPL